MHRARRPVELQNQEQDMLARSQSNHSVRELSLAII
jgi:hypothetical protein